MAIGECISIADPRREFAGSQAQGYALLEVYRRCYADSDLEVLAEGVIGRLLRAMEALEEWLRAEHQVSLVPGVGEAGGAPLRGEAPAEQSQEVAHA